MDQALGLRKKEFIQNPLSISSRNFPPMQQKPIRAIAVTSGKGGVGKSNVVINLALSFSRLNKKVLIMDADLGLANVDVLLGLTPKYNISHILDGSRSLEEVLIEGPGGIRIMPASSGVHNLTHLTDEQKLVLLDLFDDMDLDVDILLIDTGAGISDAVLYFNLAAQEKIVVVTPEPTSLTDAYALIKVLYTKYEERYFKILANSVKSEKEGIAIFEKISRVADHFLNDLSLEYIGSIPRDPNLNKAVMQQQALMEAYPNAPAAKSFMTAATRIQINEPRADTGNIRFFWKRLLNI